MITYNKGGHLAAGEFEPVNTVLLRAEFDGTIQLDEYSEYENNVMYLRT